MKKVLIIAIQSLILSTVFAGTRFYKASYRDDPSTTIVLSWCDNGTSTNAKVYYGEIDNGSNYLNYSSNHGIDRTQTVYSLKHNFARLTGLKPNTIYYFVVHDDAETSQRMYFKTIPDNPNVGISFVAGGDSRTGTSSELNYMTCRPNRQACDSLVAKIRPDFVTFNGDFVYSGSTAYWTDWFTDWQMTLGSDGHITPIIPVMGNHEGTTDVYNMFDVPISNDYFSLAMGGNLIRIYSLNAELTGCDATQLNWFTNDLKLYTGTNAEPYWKFVQYHIPFVPHANYTANTTLSNCWAPLFQQYNVKVACEAHAHILKVTWPVIQSSGSGSDHGFIRNDASGTVYIGEGSWGAPQRPLYTYYNANQAYNWTRNQIQSSGFQLINVSKQKIDIRTVLATGVKNVGQVMINEPVGTLPNNLNVWNPTNGSVVTLNYSGALTSLASVSNNSSNLKVYPVPAIDNVKITYSEIQETGKIQIYNSLGAELKSISIEKGSNFKNINLKPFSPGTYYVFVVTNSTTESCKIIHI